MDGFEKYVGAVFDNRYKIEKIIGIGGMAVVYKAHDLLMNRIVAVKILKDEIAADEQSVKRFINESRAVAMLSHQNIVNIFDVSVRENVKYIVMEYVEGITLKNYMTRRGVLSFKEIVSYTEQILNALEHAHAKGVVHRDIKPQNIMLLKNGLIKVMHFGIAKLPNAETVTMTDKAIGTVYYISPEQASGLSIDHRSDLYSLGVLMYEMACGQLPFNADSPVSVALMQVNTAAIPPRQINSTLPVGLEQIITKAMEKEREERYQTAAVMRRQIQKIKENPNVIFRELRKDSAKKKKKKPHRASHSMFPIILGVFSALLIAVAISGFVLLDRLFFSNSSQDAQTVTITNFVGAYYTEELEEWFNGSEIYDLNVTYKYDPTHDKGMIISQDPPQGARRKVAANTQICTISLVVSRGAETVVMPDVIVEDYREAERVCKALGLAVRISRIHSETFEVGRVVRTDPEAGTTMKLGETVTIYASNGPAVGTVVVPNFVGMTEIQALQKLLDCGLRVGSVVYESSGYPAGQILYQSVDPQKTPTVYANTTIDFIVSGGPDYSDIPDIPDTPDTPETPETTDPDDPYAGWEPDDGFGDDEPPAPPTPPTPSTPSTPSKPSVEIPPWLTPEDLEDWLNYIFG